MQTIILTRGIQGSGKSTWAKQWVAENPENRIRINFDDIRFMCGPYNIEDWQKRESVVISVFYAFMESALSKGYDIVVDNMNLSERAVNRVKQILTQYKKDHPEFTYTIEFKDFFIDVNVCIERDKLRTHPIGEAVIKRTWRQYRHNILQIENKKLVESLKKIPKNPDLPNCIIADMDSTICFNVSGRPFYGEGADTLMMEDVPNNGVIELLKSFLKAKNPEDKLIIVTGREQTIKIEATTYEYVKNHIGTLEDVIILFRPVKENMPGDKMKLKLLDDYVIGKYNILYAIDDSKKVVNAYRDMGILTLQPVDGQF